LAQKQKARWRNVSGLNLIIAGILLGFDLRRHVGHRMVVMAMMRQRSHERLPYAIASENVNIAAS
jgi:hypothetical protein